MKIKYFVLFLIFSITGTFSQTVQQKLIILENSLVQGGMFKVGVQVKGNSLPEARTIGSFTIDISVDTTILTFTSSTGWKFGAADGYNRFVNRVKSTIRIGCTGLGVNEDGGGTPAGYNINNDVFDTWVELNFTILDEARNADLIINNITNAIGIFQNLNNNPNTGSVSNTTLDAPINIINAPLPVELISFTGKRVAEGIQLNWKTATEVDNYGFDIERARVIGQSKTWERISFVNGNGNSNSEKEYFYLDNKVGNYDYSYRLKQIDNDGSFTYSKEINIIGNQIPTDFVLNQNYPNPFNPSTVITFGLPKESIIKLSLYNPIGEKVSELLKGSYEAGVHDITFDASNLSAGSYVYVLEADGIRISKKMILIK